MSHFAAQMNVHASKKCRLLLELLDEISLHLSRTFCQPNSSLYTGSKDYIFVSNFKKKKKGFRSQRAILVLATGISCFSNLSLSCLRSVSSAREIESGSLWLRNGATVHLWCFAIQKSFVG